MSNKDILHNKSVNLIGELLESSALEKEKYRKFFQELQSKEEYILLLNQCFNGVKFNSYNDFIGDFNEKTIKKFSEIDSLQLDLFNRLYSINPELEYNSSAIKSFAAAKFNGTLINEVEVVDKEAEKYYLHLFLFNAVQEFFKSGEYYKLLSLLSNTDRAILIEIEYNYFYILANIDECYQSLIIEENLLSIVRNFKDFANTYGKIYIHQRLFSKIFYGVDRSLRELNVKVVALLMNNSEEHLLKIFDGVTIEKYITNFEYYKDMPLEWALKFMEGEF